MYLKKMNIIHLLSWSFQSNLHLRSTMKNLNTPLDGAYLADFGIDIIPSRLNFKLSKVKKKIALQEQT